MFINHENINKVINYMKNSNCGRCMNFTNEYIKRLREEYVLDFQFKYFTIIENCKKFNYPIPDEDTIAKIIGLELIKEMGLSDYQRQLIEVITTSINSLKLQLETLENELDSLRNNIADEQKVAQKQIQISDELLDFKYLYSKATTQEKKILIRNIVEKIIIEDYDKIEIVYKY